MGREFVPVSEQKKRVYHSLITLATKGRWREGCYHALQKPKGQAIRGKLTSKKKSAGFQGEPGAFSQMAARKLLGEEVETKPHSSFRDVFEALKTGMITHAVIPIENTLHGSVLENYDHILEYGFPICGETSIRIAHQLIAMPGVTWAKVRRVFSHPVALNQCRFFFKANPQMEAVPYYDTAGSVKMLQTESPMNSAAIASEEAARIYFGKILRNNIEDNPENFTRFFLLTKQTDKEVPVATSSKVSVTFSAANTPGSLFKAMACLALRDLNIIKIESRPLIGQPWQYRFYLDFLGSMEDATVRNAIANLSEMTQSCQILGNYEPTP
jgi:prephenate dehydratase